MGYRSGYSLDWRVLILTRVGLLEASLSVVECGFIQHAGEGGEAWQGKKDTGVSLQGLYGRNPGDCVVRSFPLMDVDSNGNSCRHLAAVSKTSPNT